MVNWKESGRKRFWSIFLYYVEIFLKGLRKSTIFSVRVGCLLLAESNSLDLPNTIQDSLAQIRPPQAQRRRRTSWFSRVQNAWNTNICSGFFRTGFRSYDRRRYSGSLL